MEIFYRVVALLREGGVIADGSMLENSEQAIDKIKKFMDEEDILSIAIAKIERPDR